MVLGVLIHISFDFVRKFSNTIKMFLISLFSFFSVLLKINGAVVVAVSFILG